MHHSNDFSYSNVDKIVVKIGTESLFLGENGEFWGEKVERLCADISRIIHGTSSRVLLVTSGAVGFGRKVVNRELSFNGIPSKQYLASIGQKELMKAYDEYFRRHHLLVGQILVTHADIEDNEEHASSIRKLIHMHMENDTLPIINENDALSNEEMQALGRGADNDRNALLIAKLIGARSLYIITNTNGVYRNPDNPDSRIESIASNEFSHHFIERIAGKKSENGTGGMASKLEVAHEAGKHRIATHILDGTHSSIWEHLHHRMLGGTVILPECQ